MPKMLSIELNLYWAQSMNVLYTCKREMVILPLSYFYYWHAAVQFKPFPTDHKRNVRIFYKKKKKKSVIILGNWYGL